MLRSRCHCDPRGADLATNESLRRPKNSIMYVFFKESALVSSCSNANGAVVATVTTSCFTATAFTVYVNV